MLVYGVVREAAVGGRRVFVELELHATDLATKRHLWGGTFVKRDYLPGEDGIQGLVHLDPAAHEVLGKAVRGAADSIREAAGKLEGIRTVALAPVAGDMDGYVLGLVRDALADTPLVPQDLGVTTMAEALQMLRDHPARADAVLCGSLRDLSEKVSEPDPLTRKRTLFAQVQLRIQAASGEIPWSESLSAKVEDVHRTTVWEGSSGTRRPWAVPSPFSPYWPWSAASQPPRAVRGSK